VVGAYVISASDPPGALARSVGRRPHLSHNVTAGKVQSAHTPADMFGNLNIKLDARRHAERVIMGSGFKLVMVLMVSASVWNWSARLHPRRRWCSYGKESGADTGSAAYRPVLVPQIETLRRCRIPTSCRGCAGISATGACTRYRTWPRPSSPAHRLRATESASRNLAKTSDDQVSRPGLAVG
jgi:hypothetical protein